MDVDAEDEDPCQFMDGEMAEESMATDGPTYQDCDIATPKDSIPVAMATENRDILEASDGECVHGNGTAHNDVNGAIAVSPTVSLPGTFRNYQTFSKLILSPGTGFQVPKDGTLCNVNIAVLNSYLLTAEQIGYEIGNNIVIMVGEGDTDVARQLDLCLQTMKEGEVCDIQIQINSLNDQTGICDTCSFRIHLMSFQESVLSWQLLPEEKISRAAHHKEKGTALFQLGNIEFAFRRFSKALKYLVCCHPQDSIPEHMLETYCKLKCQCYSNLAACQMKMNMFSEVLQNCSKAIEIDPKNVKALYRRGQAYLFFDDTDSARSDLEMVASLEPHNKAVLQLLGQLQVKQRQMDNKMASGLSKMFT
ncbi:FK506-binding protein-like [Haliotis rubra]|uniref:FK506-binding protein-like n=1 Tax=Haliotis rubra TaxID=36100 RepID=UPI001EE59DC6|nr:FK506-binding protein-like [Haliotis rubra]XP_046558280.1 FK506-binding protein-like [Haliotis rubra]